MKMHHNCVWDASRTGTELSRIRCQPRTNYVLDTRALTACCGTSTLHAKRTGRSRPVARISASAESHDLEVKYGNEQRTESGQQASTSAPGPFPYDVADTPEKAALRKKTKALMDIMMAGDNVEAVIEKHYEEIDQQMLDILEQRTRLAARMKESDKAMTGLKLVKRRLASVVELRNATPTQRVINELLILMAPIEGVHQAEQEEEVERVLRYVFEEPQMPHVDIFATAAKLAKGEEVEPIQPEDEGRIPRHLFVWEAERLLAEAGRNAQDLQRRIERGHVGKLEVAYKHTLKIRMEALRSLSKIVDVAKRMDL